MATKTIEEFFTGKTLIIPSYQRDYAWDERNLNDLFGDIAEALETGQSHYLGTFILSQKQRADPVHVVDGQQRLTTLTMVLDALINVVEDEAIKQHYRNTFIRHPVTGPKLCVRGDNEIFFQHLFDNKSPDCVNDGQERLRRAHQWIRLRVNELRNSGGQDLVKSWLARISAMDVLEFVEPNEGKAIRMFQSVNDRGVPLAKMDIVKSLLIYYSNRYLDGDLDEFVAERFAVAFRSFSHVKRLAREDGYRIRTIDRDAFREDDVLRYQYLAFDGKALNVESGADYSATAETVLETFLKPTLTRLRTTPEHLRAFITRYAQDVADFFKGLRTLAELARTERAYYLLFVVEDLSTTLYPLMIALHLKGWLAGDTGKRLLAAIELADLRVFKLRGTNPQAQIVRLTQKLPTLTLDEVERELQTFSRNFMPDAQMVSILENEELYRNPGVQRLLLEADADARRAANFAELQVDELAALTKGGLSVEHILPQEPGFAIEPYGFASLEEFSIHKHKLGNLILLEGSLNSACRNQTTEKKMSNPDYYLSSQLCSVKELSAKHAGQEGFNRKGLERRGAALAELVANRWPLLS